MTYAQLAADIAEMNEEQKLQDVTVHLVETDEYIAAHLAFTDNYDDVLDAKHPVLSIDW